MYDSEKYKQWYKENGEKVREQRRKRYKEYPESRKNPKYIKQWRKDNPERVRKWERKSRRKYRENNPDKERKRKRKWQINNLDKIREYNKKYYKQYRRNKYKTDLKYNLNHRISTAIYHSLKGNKKGRHWETLVDYALYDLIKQLKKTMPKGYTWQDYLKGRLHIDHIIPKSAFNFTKISHIEFKRCWALKNLQLLPVKENLSKGNKLLRPFQLSLKICSP